MSNYFCLIVIKPNIRKAVKSDAESILFLIRELAIFEKEPEAVVVTKAQIEKDGFGDSPLFECFIAEVADQVVGMALYYIRYSTWKGPTFHLEDLIVTEPMRGRGIGTQLYNAFLKHAHNTGVKRSNGLFWTGIFLQLSFMKKVVPSFWMIGEVQMDKKALTTIS